MARLRIRLILNQGRRGAPLAKLGKISEQMEKFLRLLAADCQVETKQSEWLAVEFRNGSVGFDAEFQGDVAERSAKDFIVGMDTLTKFKSGSEYGGSRISHGTALEFTKIGGLIDPDEVIKLGLYPVEGGRPRWRSVRYSDAGALRRQIEVPVPAYGSVQGILHAWFKEAKEPYFQLRELSTDTTIKVLYPPKMYKDVVSAVEERTAVLMVGGDMLFDRATRAAIELKADRIERVGMLTPNEFESFFGSYPEFEPDFIESDGE